MSQINQKKIIPKEDIIKNKIKDINTDEMIKETLNSCLEKNDINKLIDDKEELLRMITEQSINNYLEYVKKRSSQEGKEYLKKELELHNDKLKTILLKTETEKNEINNKYLNTLIENKNLKEKITNIENFNKYLLQQLKQHEINSQSFEIEMNNISKKKLFLNDLFNRYPGKNEEQILKYLDDLKAGSIQILNDYQNIMEKIKIINNEQRIQEKDYKANMNKLYLNNEILIKEKNELKNEYSYKINNIDYVQKTNGELKERNIYLSKTLFHLYNLLFKEFGLNRGVKVDKKYLDVKESDFDPNFLYDEEIRKYVELMVKSMHHDTYDILFRETLGYLNMILRIYLPNKMDLRFQPTKAFKEIKDFIDLKVAKVEDSQHLIKSLKDTIESKDEEISKIKNEHKELIKEYNLYKNLVEKEFAKSNKIIYHLKNSGSKKNIQNNEINYNTVYNKTHNNIRLHSSKLKIDNINIANIIPKKLTLRRKGKIFNEEEIKSYNTNSKEEKSKLIDILKSNKISKTLGNTEPKKIKRGKNKDKIIRENGNQQRFNDFNKIKLLVDETNRLFLYKSRMNSTIGKHEEENNKHKIIKYGNNNDIEQNIKNKIFKQINHLLKTSYN